MVIFHALDLSLPDHGMFWAACNLAYFGFLRSAEFTVPSLASFSPSIHLGVADVAFDSSSSPSCLRLRIKASKTDPFRKGCFLHIGRGDYPLCAIQSLLAYLIQRGDAPGPLFLFRDGRPLTRALLTSWLRGLFFIRGHSRQFFQPQLPHWSSNSCRQERDPRPSNSGLGTVDKLGLLIVHSDSCGVFIPIV